MSGWVSAAFAILKGLWQSLRPFLPYLLGWLASQKQGEIKDQAETIKTKDGIHELEKEQTDRLAHRPATESDADRVLAAWRDKLK